MKCQMIKVLSLLLACFLIFITAQSGTSGINIMKDQACLHEFSLSDTTPAEVEQTIIDGEIFLKPTKEAVFKGNNKKWTRYFMNKMNSRMASTPGGSCEIGFVIDENGDVKEVKAIKMSNPLVAKEAIEIIQNSPKWTPAELNGTKIKSYRVQPFSVSISEIKEIKKEVSSQPRVTPKRKGTHF